MSLFFEWCSKNQTAVEALILVVTFIIGWALPNDKVTKFGFVVSQWIRKIAGDKFEKKVEDIVDKFDQGMKSDNPSDNNNAKK